MHPDQLAPKIHLVARLGQRPRQSHQGYKLWQITKTKRKKNPDVYIKDLKKLETEDKV